MDMDQAAVFLAGSILTALGFIVIVAAVVVVNNILAKYWKPVQFFVPDLLKQNTGMVRFAEPHEVSKSNEPTLK